MLHVLLFEKFYKFMRMNATCKVIAEFSFLCASSKVKRANFVDLGNKYSLALYAFAYFHKMEIIVWVTDKLIMVIFSIIDTVLLTGVLESQTSHHDFTSSCLLDKFSWLVFVWLMDMNHDVNEFRKGLLYVLSTESHQRCTQQDPSKHSEASEPPRNTSVTRKGVVTIPTNASLITYMRYNRPSL